MTSVEGTPLRICSTRPLTGYARDGYCSQRADDAGTHVVCAEMTDEFLEYTKSQGNNLSTPSPGFPGLRQGDKWCLCAHRWEQARQANKAPPVILAATDSSAVRFNPLRVYRQFSRKTNGGRLKRKRQTRRRRSRREV